MTGFMVILESRPLRTSCVHYSSTLVVLVVAETELCMCPPGTAQASAPGVTRACWQQVSIPDSRLVSLPGTSGAREAMERQKSSNFCIGASSLQSVFNISF